MICPACGHEHTGQQVRCPKCGTDPGELELHEDHTVFVPEDDDDEGAGEPAAAPDHTVALDQLTDDDDDEHTLDDLSAPSSGGAAPSDQAGPLRVGETFGSRYRIDALLGFGGMGAVYKAWDLQVDIPVALKVVRSNATADPAMTRQLDRRFRQELLLARQVTHKNVVRIHDLGEIDGVKYITMTYIDGEDLAHIQKRQGTLSVSEALKVLRPALDGLVAAHDAGVVHRDLKPANIMVEPATGESYIMDFGIAKATDTIDADALKSGEVRAGDSGETAAGGLVGTLQYMAPEQVSAGGEVDQRVDIYAFGLIFYDLLVGRRRIEQAPSAISEFHGRVEQAPPAARGIEPSVPEPIDTIINRCLDPDPAARFQTSAELKAALDRLDGEGHPLPVKRVLTPRLVIAGLALVAALVVGTWWIASLRVPPAEKEPMTVLIADLDNDTGDPSFDGAVEQAMTIALEGAPFISAFSRPSAVKIAQKLEPGSRLDETMARLVSRREGVSAIITSRLETQGDGYVLEVAALDPGLQPGEGKALATARETARGRDQVLSAVAEAASDLRGDLGDTTPAGERQAASETFTAASLDAMRAYARGQDLVAQGQFEKALVSFQEAVDEDPGFGRAYAGMGTVYGNLRQEDKAEASYQKALQYLDRMTERERYRTLGGYYLLVSHNYEKAIENYAKLIELYPADRAAYTNLSFAYLNTRDFGRAMEVGKKAVEIEPTSVIKRMNYAMYAMYAGDFETAMAESRKVLEQNPDFGYALLTLGRAAAAGGDLDSARDAFERLARSEGLGTSLAPLASADLAMYLGQPIRAIGCLEPAVETAHETGQSFDEAAKRVALAEALVMTGELDRAADEARRAAELSEHDSVLYPAARVLLATGRRDHALEIAARLDNMLQSQSSAEAALIRGEAALADGRMPDAIRFLREGWQQYDLWFARFLLGRAYFEAGHFPEALDEFQTCVDRKGEITDVFLVDGATLRYFPPALYWLARTEQAMGDVDGAGELYRSYLELRVEADAPDPLADDAASRIEGL